MRPREFITILRGAAAWPLQARSQQPLPQPHIARWNDGASARISPRSCGQAQQHCLQLHALVPDDDLSFLD